MRVFVNGEAHEVAERASVEELLGSLSLQGPVAVEVDREVVPRAERASRRLEADAQVEVVHFVGGG